MAYTPSDFQTPPPVCRHMASMVPPWCKNVLEPTPGDGNLVRALEYFEYKVTKPTDFFSHPHEPFYDCIVMNPPFSAKYAFGIDEADVKKIGMRLGYHILTKCMGMSNNVIALMPWFTISDSDVRLRFIRSFGLKSITALPRKTFQYARIQTCILEMEKGYNGRTDFNYFDHSEFQNKIS